MNELDEDRNRIRSYLLGGLTDSERQVIEERIFTDPAFLDDVSMAEEELLEDYVFEILSKEEAEKFAGRLLLTPEQIQRWEKTKALKKYFDNGEKKVAPPPPVSFFRRINPAAGVAVAAVLILAIGLLVWTFRVTPLEQTIARLNDPGSQPEMQSDYAISVDTLRFRSGSVSEADKQIAIPKEFNVVQLRLLLGPVAYSSYQVSLMKESDEKLFTIDNRVPLDSPSGKVLIVRAPVSVFVPGEYRLALRGKTSGGQVDDLGLYTFSISKSP